MLMQLDTFGPIYPLCCIRLWCITTCSIPPVSNTWRQTEERERKRWDEDWLQKRGWQYAGRIAITLNASKTWYCSCENNMNGKTRQHSIYVWTEALVRWDESEKNWNLITTAWRGGKTTDVTEAASRGQWRKSHRSEVKVMCFPRSLWWSRCTHPHTPPPSPRLQPSVHLHLHPSHQIQHRLTENLALKICQSLSVGKALRFESIWRAWIHFTCYCVEQGWFMQYGHPGKHHLHHEGYLDKIKGQSFCYHRWLVNGDRWVVK